MQGGAPPSEAGGDREPLLAAASTLPCPDTMPHLSLPRPIVTPAAPANGEDDDELSEEEEVGLFYVHEGELIASASADARVRASGVAFRSTSFGMPVDHPIRSWCVLMLCDKRLDNTVLIVILLNSAWMLFEPPVVAPGSAAEQRSQTAEWASMIFFSAELLLKVVALGLARHEGAFLHDAWNLLDLLVVLPFWLKIILPSMPSFAMLRLVRALRPLRAIRKFPELRRTVEAFLRAVPALSTVAGLTAFFFLVFGVVGVEMYEGVFHHRCASTVSPGELEAAGVAGGISGGDGADPAHRMLKGGGGGDSTVTFCGADPRMCDDPHDCHNFRGSPLASVTLGNFDTVREAIVVCEGCPPAHRRTPPKHASLALLHDSRPAAPKSAPAQPPNIPAVRRCSCK